MGLSEKHSREESVSEHLPVAHSQALPPLLIVVVDMCFYGRVGLQHALKKSILLPGTGIIDTFDNVMNALSSIRKRQSILGGNTSKKYMVLRLPVQPSLALQMLLQLDGELIDHLSFQRLIILSPFGTSVVRQMVLCSDVRLPMRIINSRAPVSQICDTVWPYGAQSQDNDELLPLSLSTESLSLPERRVLYYSLQGAPIFQQAQRLKRSPNTLYVQRLNALKKLNISGISKLLLRFVSS